VHSNKTLLQDLSKVILYVVSINSISMIVVAANDSGAEAQRLQLLQNLKAFKPGAVSWH
jgi:hypothetical protein